MRNLIAVAVLAALCGCVSATATRTVNGVSESIKVSAFLSTIKNGNYTNGNGMTLSVTDASPDQQSIAILAGSVVELSKAAMFMAKQPTNAPAENH